jgi:hypothetical protein
LFFSFSLIPHGSFLAYWVKYVWFCPYSHVLISSSPKVDTFLIVILVTILILYLCVGFLCVSSTVLA